MLIETEAPVSPLALDSSQDQYAAVTDLSSLSPEDQLVAFGGRDGSGGDDEVDPVEVNPPSGGGGGGDDGGPNDDGPGGGGGDGGGDGGANEIEALVINGRTYRHNDLIIADGVAYTVYSVTDNGVAASASDGSVIGLVQAPAQTYAQFELQGFKSVAPSGLLTALTEIVGLLSLSPVGWSISGHMLLGELINAHPLDTVNRLQVELWADYLNMYNPYTGVTVHQLD